MPTLSIVPACFPPHARTHTLHPLSPSRSPSHHRHTMASTPEVRCMENGTHANAQREKERRRPSSISRALVGQLAASLLRRPAGDRSDPPFPTTHPHAHTSSGCPHTHALNDPKISLPLSTEIDRHQGQAPHRGQPGPRHGRGRLCGLPPVHLPGRAG
jgi:hypothetical protein